MTKVSKVLQCNEFVKMIEKGKNKRSVVTDSLTIAKVFNKEHKNVLRDIRNIECSDEFKELNFEKSYYFDSQGNKQPMVEVTGDGFAVLGSSLIDKETYRFAEHFLTGFSDMLIEYNEKYL